VPTRDGNNSRREREKEEGEWIIVYRAPDGLSLLSFDWRGEFESWILSGKRGRVTGLSLLTLSALAILIEATLRFVRAKLYNLGSDYFEWFLCLWNDHEDRDECCIDWIRISNSSISTYIGGLIYFAARPITHKATFTDRHVSILLGATLFYTSITHCNDGYISRD